MNHSFRALNSNTIMERKLTGILADYENAPVEDQRLIALISNAGELLKDEAILLAATCFILDKEHLLLDFKTGDFDKIILFYHCFDVSIFPILFHYKKDCLPKVITFFKKYFYPDVLNITPNTNLFEKNSIFHVQKSDYSEYFSFVLEYINLLHPDKHNIDVVANPDYYEHYSSILIQCFIFLQDINIFQNLVDLSTVIDTQFYTSYFNRLDVFFSPPSDEIHPLLSELFFKIFENSTLCSLAFQQNNPVFLAYCDVEKCMLISPQDFC